nr:WRKY22 [Iris laevigata]
MVDDNDWDLFAVVRGCRGCGEKPAAEATTTDVAAVASIGVEMGFDVRRNEFDELEVVFKPQPQHHYTVRTDAKMPKSTNRSRRRRSQQKKVVCQVPADGVTSDMWSWRKYGQKPIKGSPYPRGYYRCSSSKGCLARKQTERSRTDPGMFIVTYTADHNHPAPTYRNSLAGSIRHKPAVAETAVTSAEIMSPTTTLTASVSTDEEELEDEDEAMLLVEDMEVIGEDDFLIVGDARADSLAAAEADLFGFDDIGFDDRLFSQSRLSNNSGSNAAAVAGGGS